MISDPLHSERGVALIESLVSLVVASVGLLALFGLHVTLIRYADTARQRTDATHLAQEKLEQIRSFAQVQSSSSVLAWDDLEAGRDEAARLASQAFHRQWTLSGNPADLQRIASVTVDWPDRAASGPRSGITLTTLVSRTDPIDTGSLALPPPGGVLRRTRLREGSVPFSARQLGGANRGKSTLAWSGEGRGYLVFDNATGAVIARCTSRPDDVTNIAAQCFAMNKILLDGYITAGDSSGLATIQVGSSEDSQNHVSSQCIIDQWANRGNLHYYQCLVDSPASRVVLRFPSLPAGTMACRYLTDWGTTFPASYTGATGLTQHENYLLISAAACPQGTLPSSNV